MKTIKQEFPNPVLASWTDDYNENCMFSTLFSENDIVVDTEKINIPIQYLLKSDGLNNLIKNGEAVCVVLIESSAAHYSRLFKFNGSEKAKTISIPKYDVVNKIDLTGSIIAAKDIKNFHCEGEFNEMYFGTSTFEIRKGDILATEESRSIYVDNSELEKPISSIFNISRCDEQESDIVPYFNNDKIEICLKKELFDLYYHYKDYNNGSLRRYALGIIVYPVLIEAIGYIIGSFERKDESLSDKRWFRTIIHKAKLKGFNLEEENQEAETTIADKLLGGIALDSFKEFKDTLENEVNSGESQQIGGMD